MLFEFEGSKVGLDSRRFARAAGIAIFWRVRPARKILPLDGSLRVDVHRSGTAVQQHGPFVACH